MKILNNSLKIEDLLKIAELLDKNYEINHILQLLNTFKPKKVYAKIQRKLNQGEAFNDIILNLSFNSFFLEYLKVLLPYCNFYQAVHSCYQYYGKVANVIKEMVKEIAYPLFLLLVILVFSITVRFYVLPLLLSYFSQINIQNSQSNLQSFLLLLPEITVFLIVFLFLVFIHILHVVSHMKVHYLKFYLHFYIIKDLIQYFYTIKFCLYFASISRFLNSSYQTIKALSSLLENGSMAFIINGLEVSLNQGESFADAISKCPFFHPSFKRYFAYLLVVGIDDLKLYMYVDESLKVIVKRIKMWTHMFTFLIYIIASVFIICVYLSLLLPMFTFAGNL